MALMKINRSPNVPSWPVASAFTFPLLTTISTPSAASTIPAIRTGPNFSFRISQPRMAMKTGVLATIQAVVVACAVCKPVACSHWWNVTPMKPSSAR